MKDSGGCRPDDFRLITTEAESKGWACGQRYKYSCYTQGKYWALDQALCVGEEKDGASCTCHLAPDSPGQVNQSRVVVVPSGNKFASIFTAKRNQVAEK
jgi:hypothetical protein